MCRPSERFTVEVEEGEYQRIKDGVTTFFSGTVVEAGNKATWDIGYKSNSFINPYYEMKVYGWPVFVKVG